MDHPFVFEHFVYLQTFLGLELEHVTGQIYNSLHLFLLKISSRLAFPPVLLHRFLKGVLETRPRFPITS
jgi:hypothetical protein